MATVTESDVIKGVYLVDPVVHGDDRGYFVETYRRQWFPEGREMIQGNRGDRQAGCIVGLHYHLHQADYWYVPYGRARVVLHDLRAGGPTDGATLCLDLGRREDGMLVLSTEERTQLAALDADRANRGRQIDQLHAHIEHQRAEIAGLEASFLPRRLVKLVKSS